jgi:radical SAM-linked protein
MSQVESPARQLARVRLSYARGEALRYVSHLDMQLVWERTLRRAGVPLAFSQGFNPRPRMHMACALPLGFLSPCELVDLWLDLPADAALPDAEALAAQIQQAAAPGLEVLQGSLVPLGLPPLQTQVKAAEYIAHPLDTADADLLAQLVRDLLAAESLPRERRNKPYDLRMLIEGLEARPGPGLWMRLTAREGATGRPEEVLDALGLDAADWRVERTALWLE